MKNIASPVLSILFLLSAATLGGCASTPIANDDTSSGDTNVAANAAPMPAPATATAKLNAKETTAKTHGDKAELAKATAEVKAEPHDRLIVHTESPAEIATPTKAARRDYANLWDRVRAGFTMPRMEGPLVESHERWFINNPDYMERMLQRANLYLFHIVEEVEKRGLPMEIALLPAIESAYQPRAYSRARASGLWQFIPSTGRLYGLKSDWWYDGRRDILASTQAALDYLEKLNKDFDGDWYLALASYNCGEGKVGRLREANRRKGLSTEYQDLKLPRETVHYVPKLMAIVNIVSNPERYGLELREIPNSPYFVQVDAGSQIDLGVVSKITNVELDDLYAMNPGFNRAASSPHGPHHLLIPVSSKDALVEGLSELPEEQRLQWARHQVKPGDTLARVAHNYGVSADLIRTANNIQGNRLRRGQDLLIPVSGRKLLVAENNPQAAAAMAAAAKTAARANGANKVRVIHRVRAGETLYSIARRYNVYVQQILNWNVMKTRDVLKMGQKLLIWTTPHHSSAAGRETAEDQQSG